MMFFNPLFFNTKGKDSEAFSLKSLKTNSVNFLFADIIKVYAGDASEINAAETSASAKQTNNTQNQTSSTQQSQRILSSNVLAFLTLPGIKELVKNNISAKYNSDAASAKTTLTFDGNISEETGESLLSGLIESLSTTLSAQNVIQAQDNQVQTLNVDDIKTEITEVLKSGKSLILKLVDNKVTMEFSLKQLSKQTDANGPSNVGKNLSGGYDIKITVSENKKLNSKKDESEILPIESSGVETVRLKTQGTAAITDSENKNEKQEVTINKTELKSKSEQALKEITPGKVIQTQTSVFQIQTENTALNSDAVTLVFNIGEKAQASLGGWVNPNNEGKENAQKEIKEGPAKITISKNILPNSTNEKPVSGKEPGVKELKPTIETAPANKTTISDGGSVTGDIKNNVGDKGKINTGNINIDEQVKAPNVQTTTSKASANMESSTAETGMTTGVKSQNQNIKISNSESKATENNITLKDKGNVEVGKEIRINTVESKDAASTNISNYKSETNKQLKNSTGEKSAVNKINSSEVNVNTVKEIKKAKSEILSFTPDKSNLLENKLSKEINKTDNVVEKSTIPSNPGDKKTVEIKTVFTQTEETEIKSVSNLKGTVTNIKTTVGDSKTNIVADKYSKEISKTDNEIEKTTAQTNTGDKKAAEIKTVPAQSKDIETKSVTNSKSTVTNIKTTVADLKTNIAAEKFSKEISNTNKAAEKTIVPDNSGDKKVSDIKTIPDHPKDMKDKSTADTKSDITNIKTSKEDIKPAITNSKTPVTNTKTIQSNLESDIEKAGPEIESLKIKATGNAFKKENDAKINEEKQGIVNKTNLNPGKSSVNQKRQITNPNPTDKMTKKDTIYLSDLENQDTRNSVTNGEESSIDAENETNRLEVKVKNSGISDSIKEKPLQPDRNIEVPEKEKTKGTFAANKTERENKKNIVEQKPVKENITSPKEKNISKTDNTDNFKQEVNDSKVENDEKTIPETLNTTENISKTENTPTDDKPGLKNSVVSKEKEIVVKTNAKKVLVLDGKEEVKVKQNKINDKSFEKKSVNLNEAESTNVSDTKFRQPVILGKKLFADEGETEKKTENIPLKTEAGLVNTDTDVHQETIKENKNSTESGKYNLSSSKDEYGNEGENSTGNKKQSGEHNIFAKEISSLKSNSPEPSVINDLTKNVKYTEVVKEISKFVLKKEKSSVTLNLEPESFGKVKVRLDIVENSARVVVEVENEVVKKMIENNVSQLFQSLNQSGLALSSLQVSTSGGESRQAKNHGSNKKKFNLENEVTATSDEKSKIKNYGYNTYEFLA